jgi:glycosyltransferase involved in cell wall biosynthesis
MIITDPDLRASLIAEGNQRISQFSWKNCAAETLKALQRSIL